MNQLVKYPGECTSWILENVFPPYLSEYNSYLAIQKLLKEQIIVYVKAIGTYTNILSMRLTIRHCLQLFGCRLLSIRSTLKNYLSKPSQSIFLNNIIDLHSQRKRERDSRDRNIRTRRELGIVILFYAH